MRSRFDDAAAAARKAVKLGPNLPDVLVFASYVLTCSGHAAEAIGLSERAMTLSPTYPANYLGQLGNTYRLAGRPDDALAAFRAYHARNAGFGLVDIVMIQAQAGRLDEARATAAELIAIRPGFHGAVVAGDAVPQRCGAVGEGCGVAAGGGDCGGVAWLTLRRKRSPCYESIRTGGRGRMQGLRFFAPPSVLPDSLPVKGEIGSRSTPRSVLRA